MCNILFVTFPHCQHWYIQLTKCKGAEDYKNNYQRARWGKPTQRDIFVEDLHGKESRDRLFGDFTKCPRYQGAQILEAAYNNCDQLPEFPGPCQHDKLQGVSSDDKLAVWEYKFWNSRGALQKGPGGIVNQAEKMLPAIKHSVGDI